MLELQGIEIEELKNFMSIMLSNSNSNSNSISAIDTQVTNFMKAVEDLKKLSSSSSSSSLLSLITNIPSSFQKMSFYSKITIGITIIIIIVNIN